MRKNFKGEAKKARRVNVYVAYYTTSSREELQEDRSLRIKVQRCPYVSRYWDSEYYLERQEKKEASWRKAQEETAPANLEKQVVGISKAIRAKEIALKSLLKDIQELKEKKENLLFLIRNM